MGLILLALMFMMYMLINPTVCAILIAKGWIVTFIILGVVIVLFVVLYFLGKKAEKKQNEQKAQNIGKDVRPFESAVASHKMVFKRGP